MIGALPPNLLARVLDPNFANARSVQRASLVQTGNGNSPRLAEPQSHLRLEADCGFEAPCYIAATGHLNAVEYNITYNQMLYAALAVAVQHRLVPELRHWDLDEFFRRQLPDVLIAEYHARFLRPMQSAAYRAWFELADVQVGARGDRIWLRTHAGCSDRAGGEGRIDATIALVSATTP